MIPTDFESWKNCIINDCKIALSKEFAANRLTVYQDNTLIETKKFIQLYGTKHLSNIIQWYKRIANEEN